ncbi:MAG: 30S ribosomal protein S16 [Deltaproteobacteria bacterium CG_4_8_14_3_um_filter_51_11]|nr:30S ribosomal protein S16 [bacterium]OIP43188.1 MAG: 30S ribosomal protein S16 [Desulfobacteraceae bacterium CG2_30_51_40]PIP44734.1 MAG: 30S ribosomal protein S16 [Deltaproteobacteria bacterium CG23_combo_of_CG06-09_8_20_14_all_51_20]PIW02112.1 MAG: 30S ribosomal protein S16 [Deltaproteobacteria bacterium CG17_big_fil_post_rev_8_21_14_2_50_51_6]PIX21117.1 MAG: 30S ribosomal protein S16 [Deltaproteobacteria bacterium CG_4_8_14_3_um_filter_51_11]PIY26164.1 MAG: 30S ribosomal protein S16 [Del
MQVKIRLTRMGSKKKPFYRVVAASSDCPRDGRFLEILGYYDPTKDPEVLKIEEDRLKDWLSKGAQLSETVGSLIKKRGLASSQSKAA